MKVSVLLSFIHPESSSLFAESERQPLPLFRSVTYDSLSRNKTMPGQMVVQKCNVYIKSPFKQGPEKIVKGPVLVSFKLIVLRNRFVLSPMKRQREL